MSRKTDRIHGRFDQFARRTAYYTGTAWVFAASVLLVAVWLATGPFFGWSDTWQLLINTPTTVITFWMVFVIQNTNNRDVAQIKALLKELAEDLPDVDDLRAAERAKDEEEA
jgi:low affinity Fe/Cu permease